MNITDDLIPLCPGIDFDRATIVPCKHKSITIPILEDAIFGQVTLTPKETNDPRYMVDTYKDERYQIVAFKVIDQPTLLGFPMVYVDDLQKCENGDIILGDFSDYVEYELVDKGDST